MKTQQILNTLKASVCVEKLDKCYADVWNDQSRMLLMKPRGMVPIPELKSNVEYHGSIHNSGDEFVTSVTMIRNSRNPYVISYKPSQK